MSFWNRLRSLIGLPIHEMVPYSHGDVECPTLAEGEYIYFTLLPGSKDYIAGLCGMQMDMGTQTTKWKVIDTDCGGDILCERKGRRILIGHLKWSDGNLVTIGGNLAHSQMRMRAFVKRRTLP